MNYKLLKPINLNEIVPFTKNNIGKNSIIDLTELKVSLKNILELEEIAIKKTKENTTFVIINSTINIDEVPESINLAPTLQEAMDIIDMDEMMRELE